MAEVDPDVVARYLQGRRGDGDHLWRPGQSGNPGGRPRTKLISDAYRKKLAEVDDSDPEGRTHAEMIAVGMVRAAIAGDARAAKEVRETTEGKLPDTVKLTGNVSVEHILSEATDDELDDIISAYLVSSTRRATPPLSLGDGREAEAGS